MKLVHDFGDGELLALMDGARPTIQSNLKTQGIAFVREVHKRLTALSKKVDEFYSRPDIEFKDTTWYTNKAHGIAERLRTIDETIRTYRPGETLTGSPLLIASINYASANLYALQQTMDATLRTEAQQKPSPKST